MPRRSCGIHYITHGFRIEDSLPLDSDAFAFRSQSFGLLFLELPEHQSTDYQSKLVISPSLR